MLVGGHWWKIEIGNWKIETGNWKVENRKSKLPAHRSCLSEGGENRRARLSPEFLISIFHFLPAIHLPSLKLPTTRHRLFHGDARR
jgi:hypothetical protein